MDLKSEPFSMNAASSLTKTINQQASLWVSRMNRGLSFGEKQEIVAWINQDKRHHQALYDNASFWDDLSELDDLNGLFPLEKKPGPQRKFGYWSVFFTLVILACILISYSFNINLINYFKQINGSEIQYRYATNIGENKQFILPDNSTMTLNTNSQVTISFNNDFRKVNLISGEAQFDVTKDINRPFTVIAGAKSFTALGTIFNVQKDNEQDLELLVSEGSVLITNANKKPAQLKQLIAAKKNKNDIINNGQKAIIENAFQQRVISLNTQQLQNELAWQTGMLVFDGVPLLEVLNEVSRYTNTQFEVTHQQLSDTKVSGYFKATDVDALLASLKTNFGINSKRSATNSVQITL